MKIRVFKIGHFLRSDINSESILLLKSSIITNLKKWKPFGQYLKTSKENRFPIFFLIDVALAEVNCADAPWVIWSFWSIFYRKITWYLTKMILWLFLFIRQPLYGDQELDIREGGRKKWNYHAIWLCPCIILNILWTFFWNARFSWKNLSEES